MTAAMYAYQGDLMRVDPLQFFTVPDGDQPVAGAMQDIGMTIHFPDPLVRTEMVTQEPAVRKNGCESFHHFDETIIRRIQYQVTRCIIGGYPGGKTAAHAAAVYQYMMFLITLAQPVVYELHIAQHLFFTAFAGTFAKTAVIYQQHIVTIPIKITGIFGPSLDAPGITMKIEDQSLGLLTAEMQAVDLNTGRYVKEEFFKRRIVFVLEILRKFLGLENEFLLHQVNDHGHNQVSDNDIKQGNRQVKGFGFLSSVFYCWKPIAPIQILPLLPGLRGTPFSGSG